MPSLAGSSPALRGTRFSCSNMQSNSTLDKRYRIGIVAIGMLGALALLQHWLVDQRPDAAHLSATREVVVPSGADDGAGGLREALRADAKAEGRLGVEGINRLVVEATRFESNRIGVKLQSGRAGVALRNNRFSGHRDAALWAVRADSFDETERGAVLLDGNRFDDDRIAIVL